MITATKVASESNAARSSLVVPRERTIRMKVLPIRSNPIDGDLALRICQVETSVADHIPQAVFQGILHPGIPHAGVGVRPEVPDVVRPAQSRGAGRNPGGPNG